MPKWCQVDCELLFSLDVLCLCFGSVSEIHDVVLQKPVEEWGREEVQKWLNVLGMQRYEEQFRAIQGRVWPSTKLYTRQQLHSLVIKIDIPESVKAAFQLLRLQQDIQLTYFFQDCRNYGTQATNSQIARGSRVHRGMNTKSRWRACNAACVSVLACLP